jgi:hypothetical protein
MELMVFGGGALMVALLVIVAFLLLGGTVAFAMYVMARNFKKAKDAGHDPFTLQTEIAVKALDSEVLSAEESVDERLAKIEELFSAGTISAEERAAARQAVLGTM